MAKQSTVWLSDKGEVCRTEKDAMLADASDAITAFIECKIVSRCDHDDVYQFLTQNARELCKLLSNYEQAAFNRNKEVMGE